MVSLCDGCFTRGQDARATIWATRPKGGVLRWGFWRTGRGLLFCGFYGFLEFVEAIVAFS